jgi:hypothetical protein
MPELSQWVGSLPLSLVMRRITWLIPVLQSLHILSIGMVLASVVMIDLRVWGVSRAGTLAATGRRFLPWLWIAVAVATVTGIGLMFGAPRSWRDGAFLAKLYLMGAAAIATLALPLVLRWNGGARVGGDEKDARFMAGFVATAALVLWLGATLAGRGRWIAGLLGG